LIDLIDLTGQVAFITGTSGGLGAHFADGLEQAGATVVTAGRSCSRLGHALVCFHQDDFIEIIFTGCLPSCLNNPMHQNQT